MVDFFDRLPAKVFAKHQLSEIFEENRGEWRLAARSTLGEFIRFLQLHGSLHSVDLNGPGDRVVHRHVWGHPVSPYELGLSIIRDSYLSHGTALFLLNLTDQVPKTVYVNHEQSPKPAPQGSLSQESIDRAFRNQQRTSNHVYTYNAIRILLLSGKNTRALEVSSLMGPEGETLRCTKLERTLIDATVRPTYAGGIFNVLTAYTAARPRLSGSVLLATLRKLAYVYPYHQAVGFLLERAGYDTPLLDRFRALGLEHDFYLVHGAKQTRYDSRWRIHHPEGL